MIKLKETPDSKTRIKLFRQTCKRSLALKHKLNYIFLPSELDSVKKYLDDIDCLKVGFVPDSLLPLSVCSVASYIRDKQNFCQSDTICLFVRIKLSIE